MISLVSHTSFFSFFFSFIDLKIDLKMNRGKDRKTSPKLTMNMDITPWIKGLASNWSNVGAAIRIFGE
jgi:hypothetical protein